MEEVPKPRSPDKRRRRGLLRPHALLDGFVLRPVDLPSHGASVRAILLVRR